MDNFFLLMTLLPLAGINIWHGILLAQRSRDGKPHTISEHAVENKKLLQIHRLVHTISPVIFVIFALFYLLPNDHYVMAFILIAGVTLDAIEVITLNKQNADRSIWLGWHPTTAWLMAFCYLIYGVLIARTAGLSSWISNMVWVLFVLLLIISILQKFKNFWIMQMAYFTFICLVVALAHIKLLAW